MTVTLGDAFGAVGLAGERAGLELGLVGAEAHRAALGDDVALLVHQHDNRLGRLRVDLHRVGLLQAEHVAGELDHRDLEPETEAVVGNLVFACVAGGGDLALDAAVAEAAGHEDAVELGELLQAGLRLKLLGVHAHDVHAAVVGDAGVGQRLIDGFVGVLQLDVFADDTDLHLVLGRLDAVDDVGPDVFRIGAVPDAEQVADVLVHALFLEHAGQLVDGGFDVLGGEHGLHGDVAEHRELLAHLEREGFFAAADEQVRLDADLAELRDALLRGLGLQLARGGHVGHERDVDENAVLRADLEGELAQRFQERQALDVAGGAADLGDEHVHALAAAVDALLDLVGDVRNHLHGLAEVVAAPLLGDHGLVDLAGGETVGAAELARREALVVAEVEVGLGAVVEHIDLAVLERAHGARVHVQIGVELLDAHGEPAHLEQGAERTRREPFAQG